MSSSYLSKVPTDDLLLEIRQRDSKGVELHEFNTSNELLAMTHAECVTTAAAYMQKRADVVLPEFFCHNAELPDVIAFTTRYSTVIECKISRGDFLSDAKKSFRINPNSGMGDYRYYCCPKGLIKPEELPNGWGLLWIYPNGQVRKQRECFSNIHKNIQAEHYLLFYYARRAYYAGVHKAILEYRGIDG